MPRLDSLERRLPAPFRDRDLLSQALVHSSYLNENPDTFPESNERLEFLGDALLGLVVARDLYERYPDLPEGALTALRSALVRGETLARVGRSLDLGQCLVMGKGESASGGRERPTNLAAALEALVGAVFLDSGYETARAFVLDVLADELSEIERRPAPKSPKSLLQERVQAQGLAAPAYRIVEATGDDDSRRFAAEAVVDGKVVGRGAGRRKHVAEEEAAQEALKSLEPEA